MNEDQEKFQFNDIYRILVGEAPPEFLLEVLFRSLVIFVALVIFLRITGKRMGGLLTITEWAVMLTLGAIIVVPMQLPDRGILQGIVILITILLLERGLNMLEFKFSKVEQLTTGKIAILVKEGVILTDRLDGYRISKQQMYAELRRKNIYNLGRVKRMYLEASGSFSVFEYKKPKPGLSLLPPTDGTLYKLKQLKDSDLMACCNCGVTIPESKANCPCDLCGREDWIKAVL